MFQTVKQFQNKSIKASGRGDRTGGGGGGRGGGGGLGFTSTKSFRDKHRSEDGNSTAINNSNNDAELPSCWENTKGHLKQELWSYVGLLGVFCIYFGVLVCVYALKGMFVQRGVMTFCGVFFTWMGLVSLFLSWMCYRFQRKRKKFSCFSDADDPPESEIPEPPREKTRPRGHSLAGFLTPEFAKYAEFSARDRRYDSKRYHLFRTYDPTQISISFAHKYWMEQQKPLIKKSPLGNPSLLPPIGLGSAPPQRKHVKVRTPQSSETKRKVVKVDGIGTRRQKST
ncbi:uncharacterized protein [Littorina saxatilis]|uniref:uncharacterized protein n=1 Tax=Littorina saxatilis TaxID=31220 RepID=UPI0038B58AF4